jgi:hypothetical protein
MVFSLFSDIRIGRLGAGVPAFAMAEPPLGRGNAG